MITLSKKPDCNEQLSSMSEPNSHHGYDTESVQIRSMALSMTLITPKTTRTPCYSRNNEPCDDCMWNHWQIE